MKTDALWKQLENTTHIEFTAQSASDGIGWNGHGAGRVTVQKEGLNQLVYVESGTWESDKTSLPFSNTFRWTKSVDLIYLEHLRYGIDKPISLFCLTTYSENHWTSKQPYFCDPDIYQAEILLLEETLQMSWTITGPKKNESLSYVYK